MSTGSLSDRLKIAISRAGVTQAELAVKANLSQGAINKLVSGKAKSSKGLLAIALALNVNPQWLQWGTGAIDPAPDSLKEREKLAIDHERKIIAQRNAKYHDVEVPYIKGVEFMDVNGGYSGVDENEPFKVVPSSLFEMAKIYSSSVNLISFPFHGDSMTPAIKDGSLVIINTKSKAIYDGGTYAINQNGWKRVRVLNRVSPTTIKISSHQPDKYPDEEADIADVEILGAVFMVTSIY